MDHEQLSTQIKQAGAFNSTVLSAMSTTNGSSAPVKPFDDSRRPAPPDFLINGADGSVTQDGLLYLSGFGCHFQSESLPGALASGSEQSAALQLRPVLRAAHRHELHRTARCQPAQLAVPHPSHRRPPATRARPRQGEGRWRQAVQASRSLPPRW